MMLRRPFATGMGNNSSSSTSSAAKTAELNKPRLKTLLQILRDTEGDWDGGPSNQTKIAGEVEFEKEPKRAVLFCLRDDRSVAVVIGTDEEGSDLKTAFGKIDKLRLSLRKANLEIIPNPSNISVFGKFDESWQGNNKEALKKFYLPIDKIQLNNLFKDYQITLWAGLVFLADEQQFKGVDLNRQIDAFAKNQPKIDGIFKLTEMYQALRRNHVDGELYFALKDSVTLLKRNKATEDVTDELATLDRYIFKRDMNTPNEDIMKNDLQVKEFDVAAYSVIEAARKLQNTLNAESSAAVTL